MKRRKLARCSTVLLLAYFCIFAAFPEPSLSASLRGASRLDPAAQYDMGAAQDFAPVPSAVPEGAQNSWDDPRFRAANEVQADVAFDAEAQPAADFGAEAAPLDAFGPPADTEAAPVNEQMQMQTTDPPLEEAFDLDAAPALAMIEEANEPQQHHGRHRRGPPRMPIHNGVDEHTGAPMTKEEKRMREAEDAIKSEILAKAHKVKDQEKWTVDVETLISTMETKAASVSRSTHKLRESIAQLLTKKRQIENLILQRHLQKKLELSKDDLKVVDKSLSHIKSKAHEFHKAQSTLSETVTKLQQELNKLQGKDPNAPPPPEDGEAPPAQAAQPLSPALAAKMKQMSPRDGVDRMAQQIAGVHRDKHTDGHRPAHTKQPEDAGPLVTAEGVLHDPTTSPIPPPLTDSQ